MATSSPCARAASVTAARLSNDAISTRSQRSAAVTIARVPFVVDIASVGERVSRYSRGELPRSKPSIRTPSRSPPSVTPPAVDERTRVLDLGGAEHALVAARERLADRRGGADHVDHDTCRRGRRLVRCKRDVNAHAATLAVHVRRDALLPAPGPRDARLVLGVRPSDLRGVHDVRPGRHPLSGACEYQRLAPVAAADAAEHRARDEAARRAGDHGADRGQRDRLRDHRVPGRRDQPAGWRAVLEVGPPGERGLERRLVAPRHRDVPPREHPPPALQHVRALLARDDHRAGARHATVPARLLRLRPRGLGGRALVQLASSRSPSAPRARSSGSSARFSFSSISRPVR